MKTAIIYSTTHGSTEKVAKYIAEKLKDTQVDIIRVQKRMKKSINLIDYDKIIIGGSIYLGDIQSVMSKFCDDHFDTLISKPLGLFICGIERELVRQDAELEMAFPKKLFKHAVATAFVGGEIVFDKLNPTQKFVAKNMFKINQSVEFFEYDMMDIFVYQFQSA